MPEFSQKDGATGNVQKIDKNLRAHTATVTEGEDDHSCVFGQKFNINTGDITITNAVKLTTLYVENTSNIGDFVITALIYNLGTSTNGAGDCLVDVIRNPNSTGAIQTSDNDVQSGIGEEANQNFGETHTLSGKFLKGAQGETVLAGGAETVLSRFNSVGRKVVSLGAMHIPKGSKLSINYTPPASNTSQVVQFAIAGYMRTADVAED